IDEHIISELKSQGAKIDIWGIGTRLITAADQPSLGGVYKIVARYKNGTLIPVIKVSSNPEKVTNPGSKEVFRLLDPASGKAIADYITLQDDDDVIHHKRIRLFDPLHPYLETYVRE